MLCPCLMESAGKLPMNPFYYMQGLNRYVCNTYYENNKSCGGYFSMAWFKRFQFEYEMLFYISPEPHHTKTCVEGVVTVYKMEIGSTFLHQKHVTKTYTAFPTVPIPILAHKYFNMWKFSSQRLKPLCHVCRF